MDAIHLLSATEIIRRIKMKELSAAEVMVAHLNHIDKINPVINALTQRIPPEECLKRAKEIDKSIASKKI